VRCAHDDLPSPAPWPGFGVPWRRGRDALARSLRRRRACSPLEVAPRHRARRATCAAQPEPGQGAGRRAGHSPLALHRIDATRVTPTPRSAAIATIPSVSAVGLTAPLPWPTAASARQHSNSRRRQHTSQQCQRSTYPELPHSPAGAVAPRTNRGELVRRAGATPRAPACGGIIDDALNRIASATEPDQTELKPRYNQRGLLDKVEARIRNSVTWTPFVDDIQYDAKAQRQSIDYGNGTATAYQYDELTYRLLHLTTTRTSPSNTLQDLSYTFDPVGNILQITDAAQQTLFYNNSVVLPQNLFEYDALYRLVSATGREHASIGDVQLDHNDLPLQNLPHNNDGSAVRTYLEEYQYDAVGNILEMFHEAAGTPVATWTRAYTYAVGTNRLATNSIPGGTATYTHDAHGNLTSMPHLAAITYSPWDQMASADLGGGGDVYFTYSSDGTRVRKVWQQTATAVKERIYLGAYEIYREKLSGVTQLERHTLHIMDGVQRIAMVETKTVEGGTPIATPAPKQRYQLGNHLGSAMLEVDETGLIISYEEYAPYGTSAYRSAKSGVEVSARRYRYTGKERDDETGLYYYGARYYAAWLGRWTSADPLGIGADGPGVYNYVRGSPVVYSDPSGMESWSEETVQRHADRRPPPRPAQEPKAEPEVPDDLTTGQTIDPRIDVGVPDAVPPELAFANEIRANIDALLAAERAAALTGEGGASAGLAELEARDPFAGASGNSAQPNEIGPMTDAELGFWQTLGGAYLGVRIPAGPAHAVGALTLASAESHDDPSFVLGTMAVLPGMPAVSQALDRATGAAADLAYQSAFVFTSVGGT
jgi:RHS repeat-associated protein